MSGRMYVRRPEGITRHLRALEDVAKELAKGGRKFCGLVVCTVPRVARAVFESSAIMAGLTVGSSGPNGSSGHGWVVRFHTVDSPQCGMRFDWIFIEGSVSHTEGELDDLCARLGRSMYGPFAPAAPIDQPVEWHNPEYGSLSGEKVTLPGSEGEEGLAPPSTDAHWDNSSLTVVRRVFRDGRWMDVVLRETEIILGMDANGVDAAWRARVARWVPPEVAALEIKELGPCPDGHRRVVLLKARMDLRQWEAFNELALKPLGPALALLLDPDESLEIIDEPHEVDEAEALRRCARVGMRNARVIEREGETCVIGYDGGPDEETAYRLLVGTKIAGVTMTVLRRRRKEG